MLKAVLKCGDRSVDLPVVSGNDGVNAVDITSLYRDYGMLTYDPGFMSTAACKSGITFIDGEKGILRHRGHNIEDLAGKVSFCAVAYLLLYGELPNDKELASFSLVVGNEYYVPEPVLNVIAAFPRDSHPMAVLIASFAAMSSHYHGANLDPLQSAVCAISKVPGIVAAIHRHATGIDSAVTPDAKLGYVQNFVKAMFGDVSEQRSAVICKALDIIFTMHADHEQNASTTTVRASGSAGAGLFACLGAGAATLWGPAHGGANEAVIKMLDEIGDPKNVRGFIDSVKESSNHVRLMGFGHRVYKSYDPRARIIKSMCREALDQLGAQDKLLDVAVALETAALKDEYFIERKLYPNVDFYSGIVLRAMGVPTNMFTAFFALARTTGWSAQWREMVTDKTGGNRICRPRQLYTGK